MAADEKYLVLNRDNLTIPIKMQISQKQKNFGRFFPAFLKSNWNFERLEKKDDPHSFFIFEITDSENVFRSMPKKSRLRRLFNKTPGKRTQALLKSASHHLYHIHWSPPSPLSWKKSLLLTSKILGLLVNTFAANEKYPVLNWDHLTIANQIQISQKQKTLYKFFAQFLKSRLSF